MALHRYAKALTAFERALRLDPQDADTWAKKGAALQALGRYEEALAAYEEALRLNPNESAATDGKANALSRLGRTPR
jgi:Flp pilus assembly protein TadD